MLRRAIALLILLLVPLASGGCTPSPAAADLNNAASAMDQQDFNEAIARADKVIAETGAGDSAARALYIKGRAIEDRPKASSAGADADLREAWRNYAEALKAGPSPALAGYIHTSLGNTAYWLHDYPVAGQQWELAYSQLHNDDLKSWVLYRQALCCQRQAQWAQADALFAQVQQDYPDTEPARRAASKAGARAFYVQVGAYGKAGSADAVVSQLRSRGYAAGKYPLGDLQRVVVGPFARYGDALAARQQLIAQFNGAMILP